MKFDTFSNHTIESNGNGSKIENENETENECGVHVDVDAFTQPRKRLKLSKSAASSTNEKFNQLNTETKDNKNSDLIADDSDVDDRLWTPLYDATVLHSTKPLRSNGCSAPLRDRHRCRRSTETAVSRLLGRRVLWHAGDDALALAR